MKKLSRKEKVIHDQFSKYGTNAKEWMRKCVLMLPQIDKNMIWEKKGFASIYEYAAKIAGMSRYKVTDSLRIIRKIADKPALMEVAKAKGLNAIRPVAVIATKETDEFLAGKAMSMSINTLETYARDYKMENFDERIGDKKSGHMTGDPTNNATNKPKSFGKNENQKVEERIQFSIKLDPEIVAALKKTKGLGDWNNAMKRLLDLSREGFEAEVEIEKEEEIKFQKELEAEKPEPARSKSHKAPVAIEKFIKKRSGETASTRIAAKQAKKYITLSPLR